jgi:hypothetical protein
MNEHDIRQFIKKTCPNNKISCENVFRISEELGISKKEIGQILNELDIKIHSCQIGCFK